MSVRNYTQKIYHVYFVSLGGMSAIHQHLLSQSFYGVVIIPSSCFTLTLSNYTCSTISFHQQMSSCYPQYHVLSVQLFRCILRLCAFLMMFLSCKFQLSSISAGSRLKFSPSLVFSWLRCSFQNVIANLYSTHGWIHEMFKCILDNTNRMASVWLWLKNLLTEMNVHNFTRFIH